MISLHPSFHTKVHPNYVAVADLASRHLRGRGVIGRGDLRFIMNDADKELTLIITNRKAFSSKTLLDDPDCVYFDSEHILPTEVFEDVLTYDSINSFMYNYLDILIKVFPKNTTTYYIPIIDESVYIDTKSMSSLFTNKHISEVTVGECWYKLTIANGKGDT